MIIILFITQICLNFIKKLSGMFIKRRSEISRNFMRFMRDLDLTNFKEK